MKPLFPPFRFFRFVFLGLAGLFLASPALAGAEPRLEAAARFGDRQPTGIAVSKGGRVFLCFPHWDEFRSLSVAELLPDGKLRPYPLEWDQDGPASAAVGVPTANGFYCVQSVFCDDQDTLWILDSGSPGMKGVVQGQAKLVAVDLAKNKARRVTVFNGQAAPPQSYLNDVRFDTARQAAYLTDSGLGALVVVDLLKGVVRRVLEGHPSTRAEPGFALSVSGKPLLGGDGKPPQIHADGIELSPDRNWLYYHALTGTALYRVPTAALLDPKLPPEQLATAVEKVAETGPVDGMGMDAGGRLYLSLLEPGAIGRLATAPGAPGTPEATVETVVKDPRILWPDSFATGADGTIWFTCSQIENSARFNGGKGVRTEPYAVFKLTP